MISNKMKDLIAGSSLIRAMFEEGKRLASIHGLDNVYDYSLGNPNVEPPDSVKVAIKDIIDEESPNMVHGYMNNSGYEDVRATIAEFTNNKYGTHVTKELIVMTCGAAGGINIVFKTLLNPGDEVLTFAPFFAEYRNYASNFDAKLVVVPANTESFQPNIEELENYITERTKIVLINSPNNPTGVIYSDVTIKKLTTILEAKQKQYDHSIYLLSDEPYREIVYDGAEVPYLLNYYTNTVVGYSYSKSLSLPGERIGFLVIHPEIEDKSDILASLNVANRILGFVNAPSLFQRVVAKILGDEVDVNVYKKNRDILYDHISKIGYKVIKPEGTFYMFVKTPIEDDVAFCTAAKQFNLLLVPGRAFGCPGYVRIAYCISYQRVVNSLPAFQKVWNLF